MILNKDGQSLKMVPYHEVLGVVLKRGGMDYPLMQVRMDHMLILRQTFSGYGLPQVFSVYGSTIEIHPKSKESCVLIVHFVPPVEEI